jgi:hypothetical protein
MHLIDYGHLRDGVLYHGTISNFDGIPKATWTYEDGGQKVTRDQPITDETFNLLWNGIADHEVFHRYMIRSPGQQIDPEHYHVVGIIFRQGKQQRQFLFMVPASETDPKFVEWLQALNVPQGTT